MNLFQKHDVSDFPDVYVPLAQSTRNTSVVADHVEKIGSFSEGNKLGDEVAFSRINYYSAYILEGLRAEFSHHIVASGHNTAYDRI